MSDCPKLFAHRLSLHIPRHPFALPSNHLSWGFPRGSLKALKSLRHLVVHHEHPPDLFDGLLFVEILTIDLSQTDVNNFYTWFREEIREEVYES